MLMQAKLVRMGGRAGERCCVNSWLDGPAESTLQMAHHQKLLSGPRICQAKMGKGRSTLKCQTTRGRTSSLQAQAHSDLLSRLVWQLGVVLTVPMGNKRWTAGTGDWAVLTWVQKIARPYWTVPCGSQSAFAPFPQR